MRGFRPAPADFAEPQLHKGRQPSSSSQPFASNRLPLRDESPTDPDAIDIVPPTVPHPLAHPLCPGLPAENVDIPRGVERDLLHVPEHTGLKAAKPSSHIHNLGAADRPQPQSERGRDVEGAVVVCQETQLATDQKGLAHGLEDARVVPSRGIRAQTDLDAAGQHATHLRDTGPQRRVAGRAVADSRPAGRDQIHLGVGQVDAVREDGALGQQVVGVVDGRVRRLLRVHLRHERDLPDVLRDVHLQAQVGLVGDLAQRGHGLVGDARSETRSDDGRDEVAARVETLDVLDGRPRVADGLGRRVVAVVDRVVVLVVLAGAPDVGALAHIESQRREDVGRADVDRGEIRRRRGPVRQRRCDDVAVDLLRARIWVWRCGGVGV